MRNEFIQAINQVCAERNLSKDVVFEAVEAALISAYKRNFNVAGNIVAKIDQQTGQVRIYAEKRAAEAVADPDEEMTLAEARKIQPDAQIGDVVTIECTPPKDFGRIAAQTAKQVILQRIREAERDALYQSYVDRVGEMVNGTIQTVEANLVTVNLGKVEGIMPKSEWIPGEKYRPMARIRVVLVDVGRGNRGPEIIVSRAHRDLLRRLLEMEVPEIFNGAVEIKSIAREAGSRSKVAVSSKQPRLDPVGACVGQRGYRIQNIVNELSGEKIDVVAWHADMATFIANALSPAKPTKVILDEHSESGKTATVVVNDKQLSLAIGKEGQNVRLAAKLTGWRIDIKSETEMEEEVRTRAERAAAAKEDILSKAEAILRGEEAEVEPADAEKAIEAATEMEAEPAAEAAVEAEPEAVVEAAEEAVVEAEPEAKAEEEIVEIAEAEELVAEEEEPALVFEPAGDVAVEGEGEGEDEDKKPKREKKKGKKGKAPTSTEDVMLGRVRRKPKKSGRRRDWEGWTDEDENY